MKTKGQILYERLHPKFVEVVLLSDTFRNNTFLVPVEPPPVDWNVLTQECRNTYEVEAKTHYLTCTL